MRPSSRSAAAMMALVVCVAAGSAAQTPQPFPRPGAKPAAPPPATSTTAQPAEPVPSEAMLGAPIYPSAQFIASYNAGQGQRYYLFGSETDFTQVVTYYRNVLKQKGELVFEEPPVHMFDTGRFKEETMAFPPSVTVKDYAWNGSLGYLNPKRGATPARFKTIIQIVPSPPGAPK